MEDTHWPRSMTFAYEVQIVWATGQKVAAYFPVNFLMGPKCVWRAGPNIQEITRLTTEYLIRYECF